MKTCCIAHCKSNASNGCRLFSIPRGSQNSTKRINWLKRLNRTDKYKDIRICLKHFCQNDFYIKDHSIFLYPTAIPHLHLENQTDRECSSPFPESATSSDNTSFPNMYELHCAPASDVQNTNTEISLRKQTEILQKECIDYKKTIEKLQKDINDLQNENENIKSGISKFLNTDQILFLEKGSMMGHSWSNDTVKKALKLRLACGVNGYNVIKEMGQPLPSERTLYRKIQHLSCAPGVLNEVFIAFKDKVNCLVEEERHCSLILDEMKIESKFDYDPGTGLVLGKPTVPSSNGCYENIASHGLVYMIAGTATRWKQIVGYQFTGNSFCPNAVKEDILNIIREAECIGLTVDIIISDMASTNRAIWKLFGINVSRHSIIQGSCEHPIDSSRRLYFSPDTPHVFKHIRDHLVNSQNIIIPDKFAQKYSLSHNTVSLNHIKSLVEIDEQHDLKLAPYLKEICLKPSHFEKMKVGPALRLLHNDTAAALRYCVEKNLLGIEVLPTAWFCELIFKWFKLVTSRHRSLAIHSTGPKQIEHLNFLNEVIELFQEIQIGNTKAWKPVQTGVLLATTNAIDLTNYYIHEKGYHYVCLGRFTQDALENLFSTVRMINPTPSPKYFKMAIRLISIAQFFKPNKKGNYAIDDAEFLAEFLEKNKFINDIHDEHLDENSELSLDYTETLELGEIDSLYYLAGNIVRQFFNIYKNFDCSICKKAMKTTPDDPHIADFKRLTELKALSNKIIFITRELFQLLLDSENYMRQYETSLIQNETKLIFLTENFLKNYNSQLPACHNITEKLLKIFFRTRIFLMLRKHNEMLNVEQNIKCDSRSIAMRRAIKNVY